MARRKRSDQLAVALKLAALREQQAAKRLGVHQQGIQQLRDQAGQLEGYRDEYQQQFALRGSEGLNALALRNYQGFFRNLDDAGKLQQQRIDRAEKQREELLQTWSSTYWRQQVMKDLLQQRLRQEAREEEKRQERLLSDHLPPKSPEQD